MKDLIACCGLDCEKCDAWIATKNNDDALREKTAKLWSEWNHADITPQMINCSGCRVGDVRTPFCESMCAIRKCCQSKNYKTCGDCGEYKTCKTLDEISKNEPGVLKNLEN